MIRAIGTHALLSMSLCISVHDWPVKRLVGSQVYARWVSMRSMKDLVTHVEKASPSSTSMTSGTILL